MAAQLGLFDAPSAALDAKFRGAERFTLPGSSDDAAWVEHVPGWLSGHQLLFEELKSSVRWRQESRQMYGRRVQVPCLYAVLPDDGAVPAIVVRAQQLLGLRYAETRLVSREGAPDGVRAAE